MNIIIFKKNNNNNPEIPLVIYRKGYRCNIGFEKLNCQFSISVDIGFL